MAYKLSNQDGAIAAAPRGNHCGSIRIRQGHTGNGHYVTYFWSFEMHTRAASWIECGTSPTWEKALEDAVAKQDEYCSS